MLIDINILASCDVHGYYTPWDYSLDVEYKKGGLSKLSSIVKEQRRLNKNTILVDVGDMFQGNCSEIFYDDDMHPAIVAMNEMFYDVWQMGNHEYASGMSNLCRFISKFKGKAISANVYKDNKRVNNSYAIIQKQGIKIGFIGLVTPLINSFEKGNEDMSCIVAHDIKKELSLVYKQLSCKVDVIIGLFHIGIDNENKVKNTGLKDILTDEYDIACVFCGHFHQIQNTKIGDTLVLEAGKFGEALAKLELSFEKIDDEVKLISKKSQIIYTDEKTPIDESLVLKLQDYHTKARDYSNKQIGFVENHNLSSKYSIKNIADMRVSQRAICDFFLEVAKYYAKADVSMIQLDNDDAGIDYGILKIKDINRNYSYVSGGITSYEIQGRTLKKILKYSADFYNQSKIGDVNISFSYDRLKLKYSSNYFFSGIKYSINLTKKNKIENLRYENDVYVKDDDKIIFACTKYTMDMFISDIIKGDYVKKIYSSKDDMGQEGSIRNLACRYIKTILKSKLNLENKFSWDIKTAYIDEDIKNIAIRLINMGYVSLINSKDGKNNIKSINIYDNVDEFDENLSTLGIDIYSFKTKGDLYKYAIDLLNKL